MGLITQKSSYIPRGQHILPAVYCLLQLLGPVLCGTFHMLTRRLEQLCGGLRGWDDHLDEVVVITCERHGGPLWHHKVLCSCAVTFSSNLMWHVCVSNADWGSVVHLWCIALRIPLQFPTAVSICPVTHMNSQALEWWRLKGLGFSSFLMFMLGITFPFIV